MDEFFKFLSSNVVSAALAGFITWMITRPKQKIDDVTFVTAGYSELYKMIKEQNLELEKQNQRLEEEAIRSREQESICQKTLAEYKQKLDEMGRKVAVLENKLNAQ